jgi:hypothetical protein
MSNDDQRDSIDEIAIHAAAQIRSSLNARLPITKS